jgi:hypothetical protein
MFDFFFHYKYNGRLILNLKNPRVAHFTDIIILDKILVFFNIKGIIDLSSNTILSYLFFFKYYFGVLPFFTNYQHEFKLNVHYYSFLIESSFFHKKMYPILYFFINDIYYMINKFNIVNKKDIKFLEYVINDMNFFLEKKNSLGFFYLKHNLYFRFFPKKINNNYLNLFYLFKLKDSRNLEFNES